METAAHISSPAPAVNQALPAAEPLQTEKLRDIDPQQYLSIQYRLTVGAVDDPLEREADAMAEQVMRMPDTSFTRMSTTAHIQRKCSACEEKQLYRKAESFGVQYNYTGHSAQQTTIQRKCAACEEEEQVQRKPLASFIQRMSTGTGTAVSDTTASQISSTRGKGSGMDTSTLSFMENRFGTDFSNVNIHTGDYAVQMSRNLNAQAFTVGSDIYFNSGKYNPLSDSGKHLLAHELTHTIQQGGGHPTSIQRTVHGGSSPVPTNCHNWTIPLPPWIAGTYAHTQIGAFFASMGATPRLIPRGIKVLPCTNIPGSRPYLTPPGYADLWVRKPGAVEIAEIKSTATGDTCARNEAQHYRSRHDEWFARSGTFPLALDDSLYSGVVGPPVPGGILDLSSITGTGLPLGPFIADPGKMLHVEADALGSVVYWCTGMGIINPAWLLLLRALLDRMRQLMEDMRRAWDRMQPVLEQIAAVAFEILKWVLIILLAIALIALAIVIVVCAIAEVPTAGLATLCEVPAIAAAAAVVAAIIEVFGASAPAFGPAVMLFFSSRSAMASTTAESGEDYERGTGRGAAAAGAGASSATMVNPGDQLYAATSQIFSSMSVSGLQDIASALPQVPDRAPALLGRAATALDNMGDTTTAAFLRAGTGRIQAARPA